MSGLLQKCESLGSTNCFIGNFNLALDNALKAYSLDSESPAWRWDLMLSYALNNQIRKT
jgi:hypothetical protein